MTTATTETPAPATQAQLRAEELLNKLWGDKKLGADIRAAAKAAFPDIRLPEETVDPVLEPLRAELKAADEDRKALREIVEKMVKEKTEGEQAKAFEEKVAEARGKFNLTDEGVQKMYEHMKATGNYTDVLGAAAYIVSQQPKVQPSNTPSWLPQSMNLFGSQEKDEKFEKLHRNPVAYLDNELREFAADPDKYVRDTFGQAAA